jgi:hypothetical protein
MALITNYATLKAELALALNRTDLTDEIIVAIQLAERRFIRDPRIRDPANNATLVPLSTTDPNWLLTAHPDIYYYGALVELGVYLFDPEQLPVYETRFQAAVADISGTVRLNPNRTALAVSTYAELQTTVADALNRGDLKNIIPVCITIAEGKLKNDPRLRSMVSAAFSVTGDDLAVPSGFRTLESWTHDTSSVRGSIEIVGNDQIPGLKEIHGLTGIPRYAAILDEKFRFAPAPDGTYATKLTYWRTLTALSAGVNWLYTAAPHIYLLATLIETKPWAKAEYDPEWPLRLNEAIELFHLETWNKHSSGNMRQRFRPIG